MIAADMAGAEPYVDLPVAWIREPSQDRLRRELGACVALGVIVGGAGLLGVILGLWIALQNR
jgi:hypothetical protein